MIYDQLTVSENVEYYLRLGNGNSGRIMSTMENLLSLFDMTELAHEKPNTLSGGETQRLAIACALTRNPEILICDEPTAKLDKQNKIKIKEYLEKIAKTNNQIVIIVTHDRSILQGTKSYELKGGMIRE